MLQVGGHGGVLWLQTLPLSPFVWYFFRMVLLSYGTYMFIGLPSVSYHIQSFQAFPGPRSQCLQENPALSSNLHENPELEIVNDGFLNGTKNFPNFPTLWKTRSWIREGNSCLSSERTHGPKFSTFLGMNSSSWRTKAPSNLRIAETRQEILNTPPTLFYGSR